MFQYIIGNQYGATLGHSIFVMHTQDKSGLVIYLGLLYGILLLLK